MANVEKFTPNNKKYPRIVCYVYDLSKFANYNGLCVQSLNSKKCYFLVNFYNFVDSKVQWL